MRAIRVQMATSLLSTLALSCSSDQTAPESPREATRIEVFAGADQVAEANAAIQLGVRITDDAQRPVTGAKVLWSVESNDGTVERESFSDSAGVAKARRVLGTNVGVNLTRATLAHGSKPSVLFESVGQIQGATRMDLAGPGSQTDTVLAALLPYQVVLRDYKGASVAGVRVKWRLLTNSGTLAASETVADANGVASVVHKLGSLPGVVWAEAYLDGLIGSPVRFTASVWPGSPAALVAVEGNNQVGTINGNVAKPYAVRVLDAYGNPRSAILSWSVLSGGGSIEALSTVTALHRLGPTEGPQAVAATVQGTAVQAAFVSTAVATLVSITQPSAGQPGFAPDLISISAGHTVGWRWRTGNCDFDFYYYYSCPAISHNVTFEDQPAEPVSSATVADGSLARTFTAPGVYRFRCTVHSSDFEHGMVGQVVVN